MSVSNDAETRIDVQSMPEDQPSVPPRAEPTPVAPRAEPTPAPLRMEPVSGGSGSITRILRRWKREDLIKRGSLGLRAIALFLSLLSFILVASNKHGDWKEFDNYEEYRYLLAIAILSSFYTGGQVFRQVQEFSKGKNWIQPRNAALLDFFGDQIMAYLLISSASAAIPLTNRMREGADNIFTDTSCAAISMTIFAFFSLALSAMISGYKLSAQTYI